MRPSACSSLRILRSIESRRAGTDAPFGRTKLFIPRNIISRNNIARSCDRDRRFAADCGCGGGGCFVLSPREAAYRAEEKEHRPRRPRVEGGETMNNT